MELIVHLLVLNAQLFLYKIDSDHFKFIDRSQTCVLQLYYQVMGVDTGGGGGGGGLGFGGSIIIGGLV